MGLAAVYPHKEPAPRVVPVTSHPAARASAATSRIVRSFASNNVIICPHNIPNIHQRAPQHKLASRTQMSSW